jgi:hypothetical protein
MLEWAQCLRSKLNCNALPTRLDTTCAVVQERRQQAVEARAASKAKHQQVCSGLTLAVTTRPNLLLP